MLLAVPNFSEGRDRSAVEAISAAFATGAALLDAHSDAVHNRTVLTLSGPDGSLAGALTNGARACAERVDMRHHDGAHPCIGALDVCPVVWLEDADRERARAAALDAARRIGSEVEIPVFLYGELAAHQSHRERAFFRSGGLVELRRRLDGGELRPDFGPSALHPTAGATLVTARPPLAAFNFELEGGDAEDARAVAARLREVGGGPAGVRAIGIDLGDGRAQVAINVHDPIGVPLGEVAERVRELAAGRGARVVAGEIVGMVPAAALEGWPQAIPLPEFDPAKQVIERRVRA